MTHAPLVRSGAAALAAAALGLGLPALAGAGAGSASAQTAPAACSSASPTASATATATTSPTPIVTVPTVVPTSLNGSASPTATTSASPSPTCTPSPTASATATVTTSPSSTATSTVPPRTQCSGPLTLTTDRAFTVPGVAVRVRVTGPVGADVELQAYSRPSTTYRQARRGTIASSAGLTFDITPGTNTRMFARCVGQESSTSAQRVVNVRTALSLTVVRNGTRDYTFQGRLLPRRAGQLITLYRVEADGTRILTSQIRSDSTGTYRIRRQFTGSGRFGFLTRTGQTLTNAAGESNSRDVASGRGTARPTAVF